MNNKFKWIGRGIKFILPLFVIIAGIAMARYLYATRPVARRGRPPQPPPLVETIRVVPSDHTVTLSAMGTVIPSRTMTLKSRVSGFVLQTSASFLPGGLYRKGDVILRLDAEDYRLIVKQKQAMLDRESAELKIEMGKQSVAREELRLMRNTSEKPIKNFELALRVPQLAQIKSDLASMRVALQQARLDLERTVIRAPFNCMVMETHVEPGSQISSQDKLAVLSGTDVYRVEANVPLEHLKWIDFPLTENIRGSSVEIHSRGGQVRNGWVTRLLGELTEESRLAGLLITISDPLFLEKPSDAISAHQLPLLINTYVNVKIAGSVLNNVIPVPVNAVREGRYAWVVEEEMLFIRKIDIAWKTLDYIFVTDGLFSGDEVVVSELSGVVEGMRVRTQGYAFPENKKNIEIKGKKVKSDMGKSGPELKSLNTDGGKK